MARIIDRAANKPPDLRPLPIAQTQYRASERVWLPVRDHADFENWKRIGVETRQLVKMEDVAEANDLLCRWLVIASEIAPELTKADLFTKTRELLSRKETKV